jgi:hypothetical protein
VSDSKPQVVETVPESYVRTSGLEFIGGVLHQLFVSGHSGGDGVWVAVPGQAASTDEGEPAAASVGGTETSAPGLQSPSPLPPIAPLSGLPPAVLAQAQSQPPAPTPATAPTEQGMQVASPAQEG